MRYQEALIAWTPNSDLIRVGPLIGRGDTDWTEWPINYEYTGGATEIALRKCSEEYKRDLMLFIEFNTIVVRDGIPVEAAHREFLKIDEYRKRISPDIQGADDWADLLGGFG